MAQAAAPFGDRQATRPLMAVNPAGGSGRLGGRDSWCTPGWLADIINVWKPHLDPCSNPRSHIHAVTSLIKENGDEGLEKVAGTFRKFYDGMKVADRFWNVFVNQP